MAKTKQTESVLSVPVPAEVALKALLQKKAKDIFEKEPHNAFVPKNLKALVEEIISLFN